MRELIERLRSSVKSGTVQTQDIIEAADALERMLNRPLPDTSYDACRRAVDPYYYGPGERENLG